MKIFFQGDSITDCNRDRSDNHNLSGYTQMIKDEFGDSFIYVNYACSGDTSRHVKNRHIEEFKKEKPDILIMLLGINDIWRYVSNIVQDVTTLDECVNNLKEIIASSKEINPNLKIIYLEPFVSKGESLLYEDGYDYFQKQVSLIRENLEKEVDFYLIMQDEITSKYDNGEVLLYDGVHPNELGNRLLANRISEILRTII